VGIQYAHSTHDVVNQRINEILSGMIDKQKSKKIHCYGEIVIKLKIQHCVLMYL